MVGIEGGWAVGDKVACLLGMGVFYGLLMVLRLCYLVDLTDIRVEIMFSLFVMGK